MRLDMYTHFVISSILFPICDADRLIKYNIFSWVDRK